MSDIVNVSGQVQSVSLDQANEGLAFWELTMKDETSTSTVKVVYDGPIPIKPGDRVVCTDTNCYWTPDNHKAANIPFYRVAS